MAQIPNPFIERRRFGASDVPNARIGVPNITPEDFGSEDFREWQRLGQTGRVAADKISEWAIDKFHEQADVEAQGFLNLGMENVGKRKAEFSTLTGEAAKNVPEQMRELLGKEFDAAMGKLSSQRARDTFRKQWDRYALMNNIWADEHKITQAEVARVDSAKAAIMIRADDAAANVIDLNGLARFAEDMAWIRAETDRLMPNASREEKTLEYRRTAMKAITDAAENLANNRGPQAALDFLGTNVRQEVTDGSDGFAAQIRTLRGKYQGEQIKEEQKTIVNEFASKAITIHQAAAAAGESPEKAVQALYAEMLRIPGIDLETAQKAMAAYNLFDEMGDEARTEAQQAADRERQERERAEQEREERDAEAAGRRGRELGRLDPSEMSEAEARRLAYEGFPEKAAKIMIEAFQEERKAMMADAIVKKVEREKALDVELEEAGYDAVRMKSWSTMDIDEKNRMLKRGENLKPKSKEDGFNPSRYLELVNPETTSEDDLLKMMSDPKQFNEIVNALDGPNSTYFKNVFSRIDPAEKKKKKSSDGDKMTTIDSDLNILKRRLELSLAEAGLYQGSGINDKKNREKAINAGVLYAKSLYDAEMLAAKVEDVKELPMSVRNRIMAQAALMVEIEEKGTIWDGTKKMGAGETWMQGGNVADAYTIPESLNPEFRRNYRGGKVKMIGEMFVAEDVPLNALPENARTAVKKDGPGVFRQNLENGIIEFIPNDPAKKKRYFSADGSSSQVEDEQVEDKQAADEQATEWWGENVILY